MPEKFCNGCKRVLSDTEFAWRTYDGSKRKLRSKCKPCFSQSVRVIQKKKQRDIKLYFGGKCQLCGYARSLEALDFHHIEAKLEDLSRMTRKNSFSKILKEAEKCILICANCHREIHAGMSERSKELDLGMPDKSGR